MDDLEKIYYNNHKLTKMFSSVMFPANSYAIGTIMECQE